MNIPPSLEHALSAWQSILGTEAITRDSEFLVKNTANCIGIDRLVPAILYPNTTSDVASIVQIANQYKIPLYPYSTGNNHNTWYACTMIDAQGRRIPWVDRDGRELATVEERYRPAPGQKFFMKGGGEPDFPFYEFQGPETTRSSVVLYWGSFTGFDFFLRTFVTCLAVLVAGYAIFCRFSHVFGEEA